MPGEAGHAYVHQHDIGRQLLSLGDRFFAVGGLPDDLDVRACREHDGEAPAEKCLVVGQQDSTRGPARCGPTRSPVQLTVCYLLALLAGRVRWPARGRVRWPVHGDGPPARCLLISQKLVVLCSLPARAAAGPRSSNPPGSLPSMVASGLRQALVFASRRGKAPAADLVFAPTLACCGGRWTGGGGWTPSTTSNPLVAVSTPGRQPARRWAGLTPKPHHARQPRVALRGSFSPAAGVDLQPQTRRGLSQHASAGPGSAVGRGGLGPSAPSGPSTVWVCANPGVLGQDYIPSRHTIRPRSGRGRRSGRR